MKKVKNILAPLFLVGAGIGVWFYFSTPRAAGFILYGNVDQRQVELAFIDSERIAEILVQEGMEVHPGQVLARLETRRLRDKIAVVEAQVSSAEAALTRLNNGTRLEEIDQARANVVSAEAEVVFSENQHKRFAMLFKHSAGKAVSKQDVDETLLQRNVSRARLDVERKALRLAEAGPRWEDRVEAGAV